MEVHLLRHAQSIANMSYTTQKNVPLSEKGFRQASSLSGHFDIVLCSPMLRARQTLEHSKITYDKLVIVHEAKEVINDPSDCLDDEPMHQESDKSSRARASIVYNALKQYKGQTVLLVSHYELLALLTGMYASAEYFSNAEMKRVKFKDVKP